ncbi:ABC transporter ATP-binding protein/permease [uncultured Clostridium sp.]|uniref:ABC transporter ATP-binding protein/permease n=1 Tax=uncultured Clostridium sp. TaxID=59620 RepID=UPI0026255F3B|nr:ABC transporter ATP-binding protein/permease [uncultured Clostridium sp.]
MMINKRLLDLCSESNKFICLTVFANWISAICNIFIVILIGGVVNSLVTISGSENILKEIRVFNSFTLLQCTLIIGALLTLKYLSNILCLKFSNIASSKARVKLRDAIYKKLLKLGNRYSSVESTSAIVQVSVEGVEQLEIYFGKYVPQLIYSLLVPITLFIFMSFISLKAAVVFILSVPLIPISIIAIMKIAKRILKDYWKSYSDLGGTFLENLQGLTTLKVFNIDKYRHEKMNKEAENFRKITMKVLSMQLNSITIMDLVAFGGAAIGVVVALFGFKNGEIQIGSFLIILLLSSEFFIPLRLLGSYFHIAMNGMAASDRIFKILDAEEESELLKEDMEAEEILVKLKDVSFSYDGERTVLKNIDLSIANRGITAIVGESGSGKSTIASLILNKYKATTGEVLINNKNINWINRESLYRNLSVVRTNSYIFNGTILDNLKIGKEDASEAEIMEALRKAKLDEFVNSLKDGLLTDVGQAGSSLSGGQKQRLALARAILADRKMIIFDEATSNIDIESEEKIWEAIYELAEEKSVLVISHRLANIKNAKEIYVLNKGEVEEKGTHLSLMNKENLYFKMVNVQENLEEIRAVC